MTGTITLVAGRNAGDRTAVARVIAAENHWPLLNVDDLTGSFVRHIVADVTGDPSDTASATFRMLVAPRQTEAVLGTLWAQVDAGVPHVVVSAPFVFELATDEWLNELNYDLGLHGYEATVVYVLAPGEPFPDLDPEHFVMDGATEGIDKLFADATSIARELRGA